MIAKPGPTLGAVALIASFAPAHAAEVIYRFQAIGPLVHGTPPAGSITADAASLPRLTGRFGFSTDAPVISEAGIPGLVAYALYDTGFITLDTIDTSRLPGEVTLRVGDAIHQKDGPDTGMRDDVIISHSASPPGERVDTLTLTFRFGDAATLDGVAIPTALDLADFERVWLRFGNDRVVISDGARPPDPGGPDPEPSSVHFRVIEMERVE